MFGIGMPELLVILAVLLVVIGPKKLPDLARSLGKGYGEFKRATRDLRDSLDVDQDLNEIKRDFHDVEHEVMDSVDATSGQPYPGEHPPGEEAEAAADTQDVAEPGPAPVRDKTDEPKEE